jgi:hypothetical protein
MEGRCTVHSGALASGHIQGRGGPTSSWQKTKARKVSSESTEAGLAGVLQKTIEYIREEHAFGRIKQRLSYRKR